MASVTNTEAPKPLMTGRGIRNSLRLASFPAHEKRGLCLLSTSPSLTASHVSEENSKTAVCLSKTAPDKDGKAAIEKENKNTDACAGGDLPFLTQLSMSEDDDSTHSKPGWVGNEETDVPETKVKGSDAGKREDESTMTSSSCNRGNQSCNNGDPKSGSPWESTVAEWLTQSGEKNKKNKKNKMYVLILRGIRQVLRLQLRETNWGDHVMMTTSTM